MGLSYLDLISSESSFFMHKGAGIILNGFDGSSFLLKECFLKKMNFDLFQNRAEVSSMGSIRKEYFSTKQCFSLFLDVSCDGVIINNNQDTASEIYKSMAQKLTIEELLGVIKQKIESRGKIIRDRF